MGVAFLEETFSSPQANPRHRLHQKAAQAVLESPAARDRHGYQGADAVGRGIPGSIRLIDAPP